VSPPTPPYERVRLPFASGRCPSLLRLVAHVARAGMERRQAGDAADQRQADLIRGDVHREAGDVSEPFVERLI